MPKRHRFNTDWADKRSVQTNIGPRKDAPINSELQYRAGVSYLLEPDTLARAQAAGVLGEDGPAAAAAPELALPLSEINKMKKDELLDFVKRGGAADGSALKAAQDRVAELESDASDASVAKAEQDGEIAALLAVWNAGEDEAGQVASLADITAKVRVAKELLA